MKESCHLTITVFLAFFWLPVFSQQVEVIDVHNLVKKNGIEVYNRELSPINEESHLGINLSKKEGEGIAWIKGIEFSNGIIEFDVRGEDLKKHSFVGIAFHAKDNDTFDAIYLRPFQFKEADETLRSHGVQYISLPDIHGGSCGRSFQINTSIPLNQLLTQIPGLKFGLS